MSDSSLEAQPLRGPMSHRTVSLSRLSSDFPRRVDGSPRAVAAAPFSLRDLTAAISFRPATAADSRACFAIFRVSRSTRSWCAAGELPPDAPMPDDGRALGEDDQTPVRASRRDVLAVVAGATTATDGRWATHARSSARATVELTEFFVDSGARGGGVGRGLLERAFAPGAGKHRCIIATTDPSAGGPVPALRRLTPDDRQRPGRDPARDRAAGRLRSRARDARGGACDRGASCSATAARRRSRSCSPTDPGTVCAATGSRLLYAFGPSAARLRRPGAGARPGGQRLRALAQSGERGLRGGRRDALTLDGPRTPVAGRGRPSARARLSADAVLDAVSRRRTVGEARPLPAVQPVPPVCERLPRASCLIGNDELTSVTAPRAARGGRGRHEPALPDSTPRSAPRSATGRSTSSS